MALTIYNTAAREKQLFKPIDAEERAHVCLRPDGLRLRPYRQCPARDRLRRAVPPAAPHLRREPRHLRAQHHRRRRQDQRARRRTRRLDPRPDRRHGEDLSGRRAGARQSAADARAARHRNDARDRRDDRKARRQQSRLRRRGPRAVPRAVRSRLRQALAPLARRHDRRRARRSRALQEKPDGLRALEAVRRRRCRAGTARGAAAAPAGTSNAPPWARSIWARPSTSTAAAST